MPLRSVLFRVLLAALAASAVFGVLAVLTQGSTVVLRVICTCCVTAGACALLIGASLISDGPGGRLAGLLAHLAVGFEYVLALLLTWDIPASLLTLSIDEELALTMLTVGLACPVAIAALRFLDAPGARRAAFITLGVDATALALYLAAIWLPASLTPIWRLAETATVLLPYGLLAALTALGRERGLSSAWRYVGYAACAGSAVLWTGGIWTRSGSPAGEVAVAGLSAASAALSLSNVLLLCALTPRQRWLRGATISAAVITAALFTLVVIRESYFDGGYGFGPVERLTAAGSILAGCGSLAVLVLARLNRRAAPLPVSAELTTVSLACPRCGLAQSLALGGASCGRCGLRIRMTVEEPRCPRCAYRLYGAMRRCPECGTEIPDGSVAPA